jgi:hypothetical protein
LVRFPDERRLTLNERVNCVACLIRIYVVEDANELGHEPTRHGLHGFGVHVVGVNVATDVADASIVSDLVKNGEHARDENAHAAITDTASNGRLCSSALQASSMLAGLVALAGKVPLRAPLTIEYTTSQNLPPLSSDGSHRRSR